MPPDTGTCTPGASSRTPFRLLVEDLHLLGYTRLREVGFHPTEGGEFYAALGRGGRGPGLPRLELLRAVDVEVADDPVATERARRCRGDAR
jgi:hypothetical protein